MIFKFVNAHIIHGAKLQKIYQIVVQISFVFVYFLTEIGKKRHFRPYLFAYVR